MRTFNLSVALVLCFAMFGPSLESKFKKCGGKITISSEDKPADSVIPGYCETTGDCMVELENGKLKATWKIKTPKAESEFEIYSTAILTYKSTNAGNSDDDDNVDKTTQQDSFPVSLTLSNADTGEKIEGNKVASETTIKVETEATYDKLNITKYKEEPDDEVREFIEEADISIYDYNSGEKFGDDFVPGNSVLKVVTQTNIGDHNIENGQHAILKYVLHLIFPSNKHEDDQIFGIQHFVVFAKSEE